MSNNTINDIIKWFEIAKPNPTLRDVAVQIGCHYEELSEMAAALDDTSLAAEAANVGDIYKQDVQQFGGHKTEILDALCDQIVTALGIGTLMGFDMAGALAEVNRSNYSKFSADAEGNPRPYLLATGKIGKNPETYTEPYLVPYLSRQVTGDAPAEETNVWKLIP